MRFHPLASALLLGSFFFCGVTSSFAQRPAPSTEFISQIETTFNDSRFESAFWGVKIKSLETGEVWYERNANKLFMPASNQKIPTTATALEVLGPDYKFTTTYTLGGVRDGSVWKGDLVAWSNGDPTLYNRLMSSPTELFEKVAATLKEQGITVITGSVVGDDSAFSDQRIGYGWTHGGLDTWYSAEFGPLQLNENYVDLQIIPPAKEGEELLITPNIKSNYFQIRNNIKVVKEGETRVSVTREYGSTEIVLSGTAVIGSPAFERSPSVPNPTLWYATVLQETLEASGISVEGEPLDITDATPDWLQNWESAEREMILEHKSAPLSDVLAVLMKRSQNLYAETMPLVVGYEKTGKGEFRAGEKYVEETLQKFGIKPNEFVYGDASGLSRYNYISPNHLILILEGMLKSPNAEVWKKTFPIAGVDGTLRARMKGTLAEGNVRAKTGTIANTRGLSGYVTTKDGEELVFSFLVNGHTVGDSATNAVTDGVLALLAGLDRTDAAAPAVTATEGGS
jgi:D-alanyl-D-alanine carboxypeptidase/D-alanyl-D-alanine-endopeptidase (penicillin-binding protein 4)